MHYSSLPRNQLVEMTEEMWKLQEKGVRQLLMKVVFWNQVVDDLTGRGKLKQK